MMPLTNKRPSFAYLIVILLIAAPFLVDYYLAKSNSSELFQGVRERKANADFTNRSRISDNKVMLVKDHGLVVNNSKLVFKGIQDQTIRLDLYLLDLDPQYPYQQNLSKSAAMEGIRMGDSQYHLISVSKNMLKLKMHDLYTTR